MHDRISKALPSLATCSPYLWGFAAAAAIDRLIDVQALLAAAVAAAMIAGIEAVIVPGLRR